MGVHKVEATTPTKHTSVSTKVTDTIPNVMRLAKNSSINAQFIYAVFWMSAISVVIVLRQWESWGALEYNMFGVMLLLPCFVIPFFVSQDTPFFQRFATKSLTWILIVSFIGNYVWTHYFFTALDVEYTVPIQWLGIDWQLNGVPTCMYLLTVPYFSFYCSMATMVLRWGYDVAGSHVAMRFIVLAILTFLLGSSIAFTEAATLAEFPHYVIKDRTNFYVYGSLYYALAFMVMFPMFFRLDEFSRRFSIFDTILDAMAAGMMITLIYSGIHSILGHSTIVL